MSFYVYLTEQKILSLLAADSTYSTGFVKMMLWVIKFHTPGDLKK